MKVALKKGGPGVIDKLVRRNDAKTERLPQQGGHDPQPMDTLGKRSWWRCSVCKATSAIRSRLASGRCNGVAKNKWKEAAVSMASGSA